MITEIKTIDDVKLFSELLLDEGTNFHPDDDFKNYINADTKMPAYSEDEAILRNILMEECFSVCEKGNVDIYDFTHEIYLKKTGLDKFIPLPSSL